MAVPFLLLPIPPAYSAVATAPDDLKDIPQAVSALGMADPRGGEYREVTVRIYYYTDGRFRSSLVESRPEKTHAWVLPAAGEEGTGTSVRVAVCWDGLAYPVETLGPPVDLAEDVYQRIRQYDEGVGQWRAYWRGEWPTQQRTGKRKSLLPWPAIDVQGIPSEESALHPEMTPLLVPMLLRAGEYTLARQAYAPKPGTVRPTPAAGTLVQGWGQAFLEQRYGRARAAYAHGGEEAFVAREMRAVVAGEKVLPQGLPDDLREPITTLAAEMERRAAAGPITPLPRPEVLAGLSPTERVQKLIGALEEEAKPWRGDAVRGLFREGEAAIPALLECAESDERLTRIPTLDPIAIPDKKAPIPVRSVALKVAEGILRQDESLYTASPSERLENLRTYWALHQDAPTPAERWRRILADDEASPLFWVMAARSMTSKEWFRPAGISYGQNAPLRGAALRAAGSTSTPSVSALLRWRIAILTGLDASESDLDAAASLCQALAEWDGADALPTLRELSNRLQERLNQAGKERQRTAFARTRASILDTRRTAGDPLVRR